MYSVRHTDGGKSDRLRPTNKKKFDDNWENIFGTTQPACGQMDKVESLAIITVEEAVSSAPLVDTTQDRDRGFGLRPEELLTALSKYTRWREAYGCDEALEHLTNRYPMMTLYDFDNLLECWSDQE